MLNSNYFSYIKGLFLPTHRTDFTARSHYLQWKPLKVKNILIFFMMPFNIKYRYLSYPAVWKKFSVILYCCFKLIWGATFYWYWTSILTTGTLPVLGTIIPFCINTKLNSTNLKLDWSENHLSRFSFLLLF
jgi:hypothetical protein